MRWSTVIVMATARPHSVISRRIGRFHQSETPVATRIATVRSARSAMPRLACIPSDSALARAYDVTAPITRQYRLRHR